MQKFTNPLEEGDTDSIDGSFPVGSEPGAERTRGRSAAKPAVDPAKQGRRSGLTPECMEAEDQLADPAANESIYDEVFRAVHDRLGWQDKHDKFKMFPERDMFEQRFVQPALPKDEEEQPDWHAPLTHDQLRNILEQDLGLTLGDRLDVLLKDTGTGSELMEWWDAQSGVDTSFVDPIQIALSAIEEGNMISPTAKFRGNWDMAQALFLIYIAFSLPYRIGFGDSIVLWSFWFWFDAALDIYFICDLMLNFKTAVITADGEILHTRKDVAMNYAKGWFPVDFVSCLPIGYLEFVVWDEDSSSSSTRGVRLLRLFRLLKLLRLVRIKRLLERWEEELYGNTSIRIGKMVFMVMIMSHWSCCGWYFSGDGTEDGKDGWVQSRFSNLTNADFDERYFASFFWSAMSVVKVGIADPVYRATQVAEQWMTLVSFLLGTFVTSVIIGQVADMIAHANPAEKARNDAIGAVHGFLHERRIPPWLTRRIRVHFRTLYAERGTAYRIEDYLVELPMKMRHDLGVELGYLHNYANGKRGMLCKVPFFWDLSSDDLILIGCRLQAQKFGVAQQAQQGKDPGDNANFQEPYIMREGELGDEMFIITEGTVRVERSNDASLLDATPLFDSETGPERKGGDAPKVLLGKLRELDFFGELAVLIVDEDGRHFPRTRSAICSSTTCMVQSLNYATIKELRKQSATIDRAVRRAVAQIHNQRPSVVREAKSTDIRGRVEKLEQLNAQVATLQKEISQQMIDLKHSVDVTTQLE